jgi:hypothetical protein
VYAHIPRSHLDEDIGGTDARIRCQREFFGRQCSVMTLELQNRYETVYWSQVGLVHL